MTFLDSVGSHLLFTTALAAVSWCGFRLAGAAALAGLERIAGAAVLAAAIATLEGLALGVFGLGGQPLVVAGVPIGLLLIAIRCTEAAAPGPSREFGEFWSGASRSARALIGCFGASLACGLFGAFARGEMGWDNVVYHYPEVVDWVANGRPGSIVHLSYDFPFGDYTLGNEVLMAWGAAIARSFAPMFLASAASIVVLALGCTILFRRLGARGVPVSLAVVAILAQPWAGAQITWSMGDVIATGWGAIAVCFAISPADELNPRRLGVGLLAAGLALGTKTIVLLVLVLAFTVAVWPQRRQLLSKWRQLLPFAGVGGLLGGIWLVRTAIRHGSPFWPQQSVPWGDPVPPVFELIKWRFFDDPLGTIAANPRQLASFAGGSAVLVVFGVLAPFIARDRRVVAASLICLAGFIAWAMVPGTGAVPAGTLYTRLGFVISEVRYLEPVCVAGACALLLAGITPGRARLASAAILAAAGLVGVVGTLGLLPGTGVLSGNPLAARPVETIAVMLVAAVVAALIPAPRRITIRQGASNRVSPSTALACAVLAGLVGVGLAFASTGVVERRAHGSAPAGIPDWDRMGRAEMAEFVDSSLWRFAGGLPGEKELLLAMTRMSSWKDGNQPIAFATRAVVAGLAGDRLRHPLVLIPANEDCVSARARIKAGWVVTAPPSYLERSQGVNPYPVLDCFSNLRPVWLGAFAVYGEPAHGGR